MVERSRDSRMSNSSRKRLQFGRKIGKQARNYRDRASLLPDSTSLGKWRRGDLGDLEVEEQNDNLAGDRNIDEFPSPPVYLPSCLARGDVNPALENMSANVRLNSHLQRKRKSPRIDRGGEMNSGGPSILKNKKERAFEARGQVSSSGVM